MSNYKIGKTRTLEEAKTIAEQVFYFARTRRRTSATASRHVNTEKQAISQAEKSSNISWQLVSDPSNTENRATSKSPAKAHHERSSG